MGGFVPVRARTAARLVVVHTTEDPMSAKDVHARCEHHTESSTVSMHAAQRHTGTCACSVSAPCHGLLPSTSAMTWALARHTVRGHSCPGSLLGLAMLSSAQPQPRPAQPSPAQLSSAQPSPAQPSPAQPSPAQLSSAQLSSAQLSSAYLSAAQVS